jgi:predicted PurR-regulated permease PerM
MLPYVAMLGIDRRTLQAVWTVFLFVLLLFVVYKSGRTIGIFAIALIFAHLLSPIVRFVERRLPASLPRVASLGIVYIVLLGVLAAVMIPLVSRITQEVAVLAGRLPQALEGDPLEHLPIPGWLEPLRPEVTAWVHDRLDDLGQAIGPMVTQAGTHILSGLGSLLAVVLVPILSFFFIKDGAMMRDSIVESIEPRRRKLVDDIFTDIQLLLAQYIRALVLLAMATFTFYAIFLGIVGGPYPMLLAGFSAVLEFIPAVGPLAAAITIVVTTAATSGHMLTTVLFLVFYRLFQDYVLSPYLMSSGVKIHPMLVLFGVLAGEQLLGIPGMFFSVPAMAVLRLIVVRLRRRRAE